MWNPNAAANWSLLFSPAFGAYLHMKNWEALGDEEKAHDSQVWMVITLAFVFGSTIFAMVSPGATALDGLLRLGGVILLLSWYFSSARAQAKYVKAQFGKDYPRKGWSKPLGFAILVGVLYVIFVMVAGVIGTKIKGG
jgi:hypothetical protein